MKEWKDIERRILFLDTENINDYGFISIMDLKKWDEIRIYGGNKNFSPTNLKHLLSTTAKIWINDFKVSGQGSLDMIIVADVTRVATANRDLQVQHIVITNDNGYKPAVEYMKEWGLSVVWKSWSSLNHCLKKFEREEKAAEKVDKFVAKQESDIVLIEKSAQVLQCSIESKSTVEVLSSVADMNKVNALKEIDDSKGCKGAEIDSAIKGQLIKHLGKGFADKELTNIIDIKNGCKDKTNLHNILSTRYKKRGTIVYKSLKNLGVVR